MSNMKYATAKFKQMCNQEVKFFFFPIIITVDWNDDDKVPIKSAFRCFLSLSTMCKISISPPPSNRPKETATATMQ